MVSQLFISPAREMHAEQIWRTCILGQGFSSCEDKETQGVFKFVSCTNPG